MDEAKLRQEAEAQAGLSQPVPANQSPGQAKLTLHELQVHQIELEMQNEELRVIQNELEQTRERYFDLYNLAPVGYFTLNEAGLILEANLKAASLLGQTRSGLVNQAISRFILPEDQDIFYLLHKQLKQPDQAESRELRMLKKDTSSIWVHLEASLGEQAGLGRIYRLTLTDITPQKEAAAQVQLLNEELENRVLERTAKLHESLICSARLHEAMVDKEKLASLTPMVAAVSHELNGPIGHVMVLSTALHERLITINRALPDHLTAQELRKFLEYVETTNRLVIKSASFAASLVKSFKQVVVDREGAKRHSFRLLDLVMDSIRLIQIDNAAMQHQISVEIPADLYMDSYPGALGQVLENLLHNAIIHAFPFGISGRIHVTAGNLATDPDRLCLEIRDNGQGIPRANRDRVFDPFFSTRLGEGGSGLGLSIVQNLVEQVLGGSIELESISQEDTSEIEEQGSTFRLILPRDPAKNNLDG